ncbi:MAG: alpha/beta fold hydrolase [Candidatus Helarchaeota archaeon]
MTKFIRETDLGPVTISYKKRGKKGDAVFLIHGLGMGKDAWLLQILPIAKAGFIVYTHDSRGFGKSTMTEFQDDPELGLKFYSLERDVEDLFALMDHLGVAQAHLVGISMGGLITQYACILHPDRIISAVIANSFSYPHGRINYAGESWLRAAELMSFSDVFDILLPWTVGEKTLESSLFEGIYEEMKAMYIKANSNWCFVNKIRAIQALGQTLQERVKEIKTPVLLIGGGDDILTPPKYQEYTKSLIPHAESTIIPNAGHASILDNPEAFNRAVLSFLKKHSLTKS